MAHGQNITARLQHATRNANVTLMMLRLVRWLESKSSAVEWEGETWVANSIDEWAVETGLSGTQSKYVFESGRKLNLIKTTMRWHRKRWRMHTALTPRSRAVIAGAEDDSCPSDQGTDATSDKAKAPALIKEQDTIQEIKQEKISENLPKGSLSPPETLEGKLVSGKTEKDTEAMKMSDVEKHVIGNKHLHKPDSVQALAFLWKQKLSEESGAMVVLKAKEYGQLKLFQKQCSPDTAFQVLTWVLDNWNAFSKGVMSEADLKSTPASPLLGFVLQWSAKAVIGWTQSTKTAEPQTPTKQEAPVAVSASKTLQLISTMTTYPDSIEEIMG